MVGNNNNALKRPTAAFTKRLIEEYPEAKVVLTVRDADSWLKSMRKTIFQSLTIPITSEKGKRTRAMSKAVIMDGILNDIQSGKEPDEEIMKEKYSEHNAWVQLNVPSARLLLLNLGEGWDRLCTFLEMPVPDVPYPHSNSAEEFTQHCKEGIHPYLK